MTRHTICAGKSALLLLLSFPLSIGCTSPPEGSTIAPSRVEELLRSEEPPLILDVRTPDEFSQGHVPGAVNIPHTELAARISELGVGTSGQIVVYCEAGGRAATAESILREAGFTRILDMSGHMRGWRSAGLPVER